MSLKGYIKRKKYFWSNPEVYRQYQEVKTVNNFSGGGGKNLAGRTIRSD